MFNNRKSLGYVFLDLCGSSAKKKKKRGKIHSSFADVQICTVVEKNKVVGSPIKFRPYKYSVINTSAECFHLFRILECCLYLPHPPGETIFHLGSRWTEVPQSLLIEIVSVAEEAFFVADVTWT